MELLRKGNKKNSIVVFGLNILQPIKIESICAELESLLEVHITPNDINDIYQLGKHTKCPLKVEFSTNWKQKEVLKKLL